MKSTENLVSFPPQVPRTCAECGSDQIQTSPTREEFPYGSGADQVTLSAVVQVHQCGKCGSQFTDESAEQVRHEAVCRHLHLMTPREVQGVRRRYELSRADFSGVAGVGEASLARWENGLLIQNASNDRLLYLLTFPENLERLKSRNRGENEISGSSRGPTSVLRCLQITDARVAEAASFRLRRSAARGA